MGRINITSTRKQNLKEALLTADAHNAFQRQRALKSLMSDRDKEIFSIAEYISKVMRVVRKVPFYSALPTKDWKNDPRWGMYERLRDFCEEWSINPKLWIDAQIYVLREWMDAPDDEVYLSYLTSTRDKAMELFDRYCIEFENDIRVRGAMFDNSGASVSYGEIERNRRRDYEFIRNLRSGYISETDFLAAVSPKLEKFLNAVSAEYNSLHDMGKNEKKRKAFSDNFSLVPTVLIPLIPTGRMEVMKVPEWEQELPYLTEWYFEKFYPHGGGLFKKVRELWISLEAERGLPRDLLGIYLPDPELTAKFGKRGYGKNLLFNLPGLPRPDEIQKRGYKWTDTNN